MGADLGRVPRRQDQIEAAAALALMALFLGVALVHALVQGGATPPGQ